MYESHQSRPAPASTFDQMLERIRYDGVYPTREHAEGVTRVVLTALGGQITGDERRDLARRLPAEASLALTDSPVAAEPLTGWGFVEDIAARTGGTPATVRWGAGAVLAVVASLAGPDLLARVLRRLPDGYALLFGRAELRQSVAQAEPTRLHQA